MGMNRKRKITILVTIAFLVNILPGCGIVRSSHHIDTTQLNQHEVGENLEEKDQEMEEEKPIHGGSISIPMVKTDILNPLISSSKDIINICGLIYEGLVDYDDELKPVPVLAESWSVSEDGTVWTFKLRQDVKWHDNTPLSADDVIFTINVLRSGRYDTYYVRNFNRIDCIENIGVLGQDAFYIRLSHPVSCFLDAMIFPILPKHVYEHIGQVEQKKVIKKNTNRNDKIGEEESNEEDLQATQYMRDDNLPPIGTGPYKIDMNSYNLEEGFSLIKNENYWNKRPYIDRIDVKIYEDNSDIINAFQTKQVDVLETNVVFARTYANATDVVLYRYLTQNYEFLAINHTNPILGDVRVRKALAYGIDRKSIINEIYLNNAEAVDVPIPSDSWLYDGSYRIYDCDVDRAIELLEEAGWHDTDGDGIRDKNIDGVKYDLTLTFVTNMENDIRKDVAEAIKRQLEEAENELGIQIQIQLGEWEEIKEQIIPNGEFDILLTGCYLPVMPDLESLFASYSDGNFIYYNNPELDELIGRAKHVYTEDVIKETYKEIQKHLVEQLPIISLYFPTSSLIISENIRGKICPRELDIYRDIQQWYVSDKK